MAAEIFVAGTTTPATDDLDAYHHGELSYQHPVVLEFGTASDAETLHDHINAMGRLQDQPQDC
ncbi:MAG TPA: hypothetical protein VME67_18795 [Mycobacterium sp.]|nr:hypothetical protein [Mycobacterium sp.]HTX96720.1 hypothetical protein [Mycobacterium sp.]